MRGRGAIVTSEAGVIRIGKGISLVISNEDMAYINIAKSPGNSGVLIDGVSETVKHEMKKQES